MIISYLDLYTFVKIPMKRLIEYLKFRFRIILSCLIRTRLVSSCCSISSQNEDNRTKKKLIKVSQIHNTVAISEKYGALHNFLHPCVSYIDRESEGGEDAQ